MTALYLRALRGSYMGAIWVLYGRYMGAMWAVCGRYVGAIWLIVSMGKMDEVVSSPEYVMATIFVLS